MSQEYEAALLMATLAHAGQKRWNGDPYMVHPIMVVMLAVQRAEAADWGRGYEETQALKIAAILHDVVEDSDITVSVIQEAFGEETAERVRLLTREEGLSYEEFIYRLRTSGNEIAIRVKLADLEHNMSDLPEGASLLKRYEPAKERLNAALRRILAD